MLKNRYAKNTYGPKCQNTHGPKLWLLNTWAWALGRSLFPPPTQTFPGAAGPAAAAGRPGGGGPCAQGHGPMPMCPGAKALAHEYFDIWAHKYF